MSAWENIPTDEEIQSSAGFVYLITCQVNMRKYIGKKLFTSSRRRKVSCRKNGKSIIGKKKVVRDRIDSNWREYYGSSAELLEDIKKYGKENFRREILQLAPTKGVLSYYELKHQLAADALLRSDYYNSIVNVRLGRNVFPKWMIEEADKQAHISVD